MVERGHKDGVAPDEWIGYELAKVKRTYDHLNLPDRVEIAYFNGPHMIDGPGHVCLPGRGNRRRPRGPGP